MSGLTQRQMTGRTGEILAGEWLEKNGFLILARNWRNGRDEVDLIVARDRVLHFIEVKTRRSLAFGYPEEFVNRSKITRMMRSATAFLAQSPWQGKIQLDILSVLLFSGRDPEFFFCKDVYTWRGA